jgi:hypothetical protein
MLIGYAADDKTLQDATVLLGHASPEDVASALSILLGKTGREEDLALTLLDFVDERRMQDLIDLLKSEFPLLESFPEAMRAISVAGTGTPRVGKATGWIARAWEPKRGTRGFCGEYENGRVYWSRSGEAYACYGEINEYYDNHRGSGGALGFPLSAEDSAEPWALPVGGEASRTEGRYQRFEGPSDYGDEACARSNGGLKYGATVYWCDDFGSHAALGRIGEFYELNDGTGGWLGFPVEDEVQVKSKAGTKAVRQRFQGGVIYYRSIVGTIAVPYPIAACHNWDRRDDDTRLPEGPREEVDAGSSSGTRGYRQRFERSVTVYESVHGVHIVGWGIRSGYDKLGGPSGWLGFPKSEEAQTQLSAEGPVATVQEFEGGAIYYRDTFGPISIPRSVRESIAEHGLWERIGFPVEKQYSLGSGPDDRIYFFEHGLVTVRNGVAELWLPPGLAAP